MLFAGVTAFVAVILGLSGGLFAIAYMLVIMSILVVFSDATSWRKQLVTVALAVAAVVSLRVIGPEDLREGSMNVGLAQVMSAVLIVLAFMVGGSDFRRALGGMHTSGESLETQWHTGVRYALLAALVLSAAAGLRILVEADVSWLPLVTIAGLLATGIIGGTLVVRRSKQNDSRG